MAIEQVSSGNLKKFSEIALLLAQEGGVVLQKYWGNLHQIQDKQEAGDLVTEADKESEQRILSLIQSLCPTHAVLAEESGVTLSENKDFLWVIDPLDGTTNYAHQYPQIAVSIALLYQNQPIVAVVFNPICHELFQAQKGKGATLNGRSLSVSNVKSLNKSLLATGFAYNRRHTLDTNYPEFCHLTHLSQGVRRSGSAALDLAYVAAGRLDGYWERGIRIWDIAAGVLILTEAGGQISDYEGHSLDLYKEKILATNGWVHHELSRELIAVRNKEVRSN